MRSIAQRSAGSERNTRDFKPTAHELIPILRSSQVKPEDDCERGDEDCPFLLGRVRVSANCASGCIPLRSLGLPQTSGDRNGHPAGIRVRPIVYMWVQTTPLRVTLQRKQVLRLFEEMNLGSAL